MSKGQEVNGKRGKEREKGEKREKRETREKREKRKKVLKEGGLQPQAGPANRGAGLVPGIQRLAIKGAELSTRLRRLAHNLRARPAMNAE